MKLRYKIGLVIAVLGITFSLGRCNRIKTSDSKLLVPTVLPKDDIERIIVNPETHKLTIVTEKGIRSLTLPDRDSVIDLKKDGSLVVTAKQFGFEHHVFVGAFQSNDFRLGSGVDLGYWKRLDLGFGLAATPGLTTPIVFGQISYNVWHSIRLGLTYDNRQHIGVGLSIRL